MSSPTKSKLSTPDIPASEAVFTVSATTRINASASLVFRTLRNTETWKDWNRFVPRVTITHQPPEDDTATQEEIEEIVRNTSIAGSIDSDIVEGVGFSPAGNRRPKSPEEGQNLIPRPVIRQRLASNASRTSTKSTSEDQNPNPSSHTAAAAKAVANVNGIQSDQSEKATSKTPNRSASMPEVLSKGMTGLKLNDNDDNNNDKKNNNNISNSQTKADVLGQDPSSPTSPTSPTSPPRRRGSLAVVPAQSRAMSLLALYGEPPVRIQLGTKLTFHVRMKLPTTQTTSEVLMIVTEVSRPEEPDDNFQIFPKTVDPFAASKTKNKKDTSLQKSQTHTNTKTGVYRVVWGMLNQYDPPKAFPKFLLQTQRVHEIRPILTGDGRSDVQCEYSSWENQKGMLAKRVNKKHGQYLQERFEQWNLGLKEFCETMGGAVERRDFSIY